MIKKSKVGFWGQKIKEGLISIKRFLYKHYWRLRKLKCRYLSLDSDHAGMCNAGAKCGMEKKIVETYCLDPEKHKECCRYKDQIMIEKPDSEYEKEIKRELEKFGREIETFGKIIETLSITLERFQERVDKLEKEQNAWRAWIKEQM